jgi:hypothetical protein
MNELSRLSKENAELRSAATISETTRKTQAAEEQRKINGLLQNNKIKLSFFFKGDSGFTESPKKTSLYSLFRRVAPEIMVEAGLEDLARVIAINFRPKDLMPNKQLRSEWPIPSNQLNDWLADLQALGLIMPSHKKHQVKDTDVYWSISDLGKTIYTQTRIAVLERATREPPDDSSSTPLSQS